MVIKNVQNALVSSAIETEGGDIIVNGSKITNVYHFPEFNELQQTQNRIDERIIRTKERIIKFPSETEFAEELSALLSEKEEITLAIKNQRREILALADQISKIPLDSERLKKARKLFEEGKFSAAQEVLNLDLIKEELDQLLEEKKIISDSVHSNKQNLLLKSSEFLMLAIIAANDDSLQDKIEVVKQYFDLSLKSSLTLDNIESYTYYLLVFNCPEDSLNLCKTALQVVDEIENPNTERYYAFLALICERLGEIYFHWFEYGPAKEYFLAAQKNLILLSSNFEVEYYDQIIYVAQRICETTVTALDFSEQERILNELLRLLFEIDKKNPRKYIAEIANTLKMLGELHYENDQLALAEHNLQQAFDLFKSCYNKETQKIETDHFIGLIETLKRLGDLFKRANLLEASLDHFERALFFVRTLDDLKSELLNDLLADILLGIGDIHRRRKDMAAAEAAYMEALQLRRSLSIKNPIAYHFSLATLITSIGILYKELNKMDLAEEYYLEALTLRRHLAESNALLLGDVAISLNNIGNYHVATRKFDIAEIEFLEAEDILRSDILAKKSNHLGLLANILNGHGSLFIERQQFDQAENKIKEAVSILTDLSKQAPLPYALELGSCAATLSEFYKSCIINRESSISYARRALLAVKQYQNQSPIAAEVIARGKSVLNYWSSQNVV